MAVPFAQVRTIDGLAANLGCAVADLTEFTEAAEHAFYTPLHLPKKGKRRGEVRVVYAVQQRLALVQKNLATWIASYTDFPEYVQGFVHHRSIGSNARFHLGQKYALHTDITDFFDTIEIRQVEDAFQVLGCPQDIARVLAQVSTLNGRLPQGSSASPILANLVCRHLDADLDVLARANGCRFSRYADDITISGDVLPQVTEVAAILQKHGFRIRQDKTRVQRRGRSQFVTGLTIADPAGPHVPKVQKRRLRLELYYAGRFGLPDHLDRTHSVLDVPSALARFHGWINFIYSVEGSGSLYRLWKKVRDVGVEPPDHTAIIP